MIRPSTNVESTFRSIATLVSEFETVVLRIVMFTVVVFFGPIHREDFDSFLVNFIIVVTLKILNLLQTFSVINHLRVYVIAPGVALIQLLFTYFKNVL